ncbi:MAG: competence protein [Candidatus Amoebophilus sp. 36-38]|nr:MAG: competence protein [Candidatus Amoebophilus sp. 36-38]
MFRDFISLIFPNYCLACQTLLVKSERWLCTGCLVDLPQTNYHTEVNNPVAQKFYGRIPITYAMAMYKFRIGSSVQRLVHQLKYGNTPEIGEMLGNLYGEQLRSEEWDYKFDCIVPVPLHPQRLRERGYNQSDYFAKGMASVLAISWYSDCLKRTKNTVTQTHQNKMERLDNLMDAFYVVNSSIIQNKHVLLVDDVITTGSTLEACALSLLAAGTKQISIATIAVTD